LAQVGQFLIPEASGAILVASSFISDVLAASVSIVTVHYDGKFSDRLFVEKKCKKDALKI
jgi:hypothetical protein